MHFRCLVSLLASIYTSIYFCEAEYFSMITVLRTCMTDIDFFFLNVKHSFVDNPEMLHDVTKGWSLSSTYLLTFLVGKYIILSCKM